MLHCVKPVPVHNSEKNKAVPLQVEFLQVRQNKENPLRLQQVTMQLHKPVLKVVEKRVPAVYQASNRKNTRKNALLLNVRQRALPPPKAERRLVV